MRSIFQSLGSVILGLIVAFVLIIAIELFSAVVHPLPDGFDYTTDALNQHVANYPDWVLGLVVPAWGVMTFASVWLATRLGTGRHPAHGIVVGLLLLLAVAYNMYLLPYPSWFEVANVAAFLTCIYLGKKLGQGRALPSPESPPET